MPKPGRRTKEMHHVSFRMPTDVYRDYAALAESRGVDLSAVLNWVMVEYRPLLLLRRAEYGAAMLRAAVVDLPDTIATAVDPQESLTNLNRLIGQLQEVA